MTIKRPLSEAEPPVDDEGQREGGVADAKDDPALREALNRGSAIVRQMDSLMHQDPGVKPENLAEWEALMEEFADVRAEYDKAAEEAKLQQEIDEHMNRIAAQVDWLANLDPIDLQTNLEVEEKMAGNFAAWNELDAVMRLRCRDFPDKVARWEEEVMKPMRKLEAIFEAGVAAEKAKPEN